MNFCPCLKIVQDASNMRARLGQSCFTTQAMCSDNNSAFLRDDPNGNQCIVHSLRVSDFRSNNKLIRNNMALYASHEATHQLIKCFQTSEILELIFRIEAGFKDLIGKNICRFYWWKTVRIKALFWYQHGIDSNAVNLVEILPFHVRI